MAATPTPISDVTDLAVLHKAYHAAIDGLTGHQSVRVETRMGQAVGYVWGLEDAGTPRTALPGGTDPSYAFGLVYAIQVADFEAERVCSLASVREAHTRWVAEVAARRVRRTSAHA